MIVVFVLSLPAVTPRIYASDEVQYFSYLRSLWFDGDVSFENEYRYFYDSGIVRTDGFRETFLERAEPTGRRINFATMGCAILWSPFYGAAHAGVLAARLAGANADANGMSQPYVAAVAYGSAVYGFLAVLLSIHVANRLVGRGLPAGVIVWFGTPLLFYMYVTPPMSHACSAFAVALFVTIWLGVRDTWTARGAALLGASAALMTMVREQDAFFAVGPALDAALSPFWRMPRGAAVKRVGRTAATGIAAFVLCYSPQLFAYTALNGHPGPSGVVARKMSWTSPHRTEVLLSPEHGFFFWTPLAALAVAGLVAGSWLRKQDLPRKGDHVLDLLIVMVLAQVFVSGAVESWTVAGAFGQRRFVSLTVILAVGIAVWWRIATARPARMVLGVVTAVCIYWNIALMAQFGTGMMDRQRLELRRNAYNAFVRLPAAAPQVLYSYFVRRESFYRNPTDRR